MPLEFHLLDVGQGECTFVDFPDGTYGVVDGGPCTKVGMAVQGAIAGRAGRHCRFVAASQWDRDHVAGLPEIVLASRPDFLLVPSIGLGSIERIVAFLEGASKPRLPIIESLRDACSRVGAAEHDIGRGHHLPLAPLADVCGWGLGPPITLLHEVERRIKTGADLDDFRDFRNAASMVLWFSYRGRAAMLCGEQSGDSWRTTYDFCRSKGASLGMPADPRADWLKLSHHGGAEENNGDLFQYFGRSNVFVGSASSSGRQYGHPHPQALAELRRSGGIAMCSRLGQGCQAIQVDGHNPMVPELWAHKVSRLPKAGSLCHGTLRVVIDETGRVEVLGQHTQTRCPYGAPASGKHVF